MERVKLKTKKPKKAKLESNGLYLKPEVPVSSRPYFSTGCTILDLHLGGGWCEGQIIQIAGDSQTGKSLLAIEAIANFNSKYKSKCETRYVDTENAYDGNYAERLGVDQKRVQLPDIKEVPHTVEHVTKDVLTFFKGKQKKPLLYIVDSWDGLSDLKEMKRDVTDSKGFGTGKSVAGSEFGRRLSSKLKVTGFTLMVIQQTRDNVGGYGAPKKVSGGGWLKFYATQSIWLSAGKVIEGTRKGHKRAFGQWMKIKIPKNRRSGPTQLISVPILFGYGIDDLAACINFLIEEGCADRMFDSSITKAGKKKTAEDNATTFLGTAWTLPKDEYDDYLVTAKKEATKLFYEIKTAFMPGRKKYT